MICKKKALFFLVFVFLLSPTMRFVSSSDKIDFPRYDYIANLVLRTEPSGPLYEYAQLIKGYLEHIGINVEIKTEDQPIFVGTLCIYNDFDMILMEIDNTNPSPDMRKYYTQEGDENVFGLDRDMPYGNLSETMQEEGVSITDTLLRQQHYYGWQELMMNQLVPMFPLFSPRDYVSTWTNTLGYDGRWGIADSLPYMEYDGYHENQTSLDEFNVPGYDWENLLPFGENNETEQLIMELITEPIITLNPDLTCLKTGVVNNWNEIEDGHYKFYLRDNIYWNPSYYITDRNESSIPLSSLSQDYLMEGLKDNSTSTGLNQQVTAKDAVFTLLLYANEIINENSNDFDWITNVYVDPVDSMAFHIVMDANLDTVQRELYVDFWTKLPLPLLPEFFLNSSRTDLSLTGGGAECIGIYEDIKLTPQWENFSISPFGCGKYMLDYYTVDKESVLQKNPNWFGIGAIDGTEQDLDIDTINIHVIPDFEDQLAEFLGGYLDWFKGLFPREYVDPWGEGPFDVQTFITDKMYVLAFNMQRPFMGGAENFQWIDAPDKSNYARGCASRKAICYAINRDEMNQIVHDGEALKANSVLLPSTAFFYYNDIIKYEYDLDKAKEWLGYYFGGIPDFTYSIINQDNFHDNVSVKIYFTNYPEIVDSVIYYKINEGEFTSKRMIKEGNNIYSYNFGSSFNTSDNITFFLKIKNKDLVPFYSYTFSFLIGNEFTRRLSYDIYSMIIVFFLGLLYFWRRKSKK